MTDIMVDTPLDGIIATNATTRAGELKTPSEVLRKYGNGAISGEPLTKRSIEVVKRVYERCNGTYPIIGVGGIMCADDVKAMFDAGATLVQVYTGIVYEGIGFAKRVCKALVAPKDTASQNDTTENDAPQSNSTPSNQ